MPDEIKPQPEKIEVQITGKLMRISTSAESDTRAKLVFDAEQAINQHAPDIRAHLDFAPEHGKWEELLDRVMNQEKPVYWRLEVLAQEQGADAWTLLVADRASGPWAEESLPTRVAVLLSFAKYYGVIEKGRPR